MSTKLMLLGLLEPTPSHGYELKRAYDARFAAHRPLKFGQVYATLARFERTGLARVTGVEHGSGPDRKLFAITPDGVAEIDSWIGTPEPPQRGGPSALYAKVTLALLSGRPANQVLDAQRTCHLARMRELTQRARAAEVPDRLAADYEIAHLDADLKWIDEAGQRLDAWRSSLVVGSSQ